MVKTRVVTDGKAFYVQYTKSKKSWIPETSWEYWTYKDIEEIESKQYWTTKLAAISAASRYAQGINNTKPLSVVWESA